MSKALLTRRRDQVTYQGGPLGHQLIGGIIFCGSDEARRNWIRRLSRSWQGFNYFTCFCDVQSPWALQFGFAEWQPFGKPHVNW